MKRNTPTDNQQESALGMRAILRIPNYSRLWLGQVISNFGDSLTNLTLLILVNELTGSTAAIALMAIVLGIPKVLFGTLAGVYVDRLNRQKIMIYSDILRGIVVLGFLLITDVDMLWLLYAIAFTQSTIGTLFNPARSALIPHLVPENGLMSANALIQTSGIFVAVLGAGAAGVLTGVFNVYAPAFILDAFTFFISAWLITRIVLSPEQAQPTTTKTKANLRVITSQLKEGLVIIFKVRALAGVLVAAGVAMLGLGAINILIVPFLVNDLKVPETWFGVVQLVQVTAMMISGAFVAMIARRLAPPNIISIAMIVTGILLSLIAGVGAVWQLFVILFVLGLVMTPLQASISTIMQTAVEDEMRGRVNGALDTMIQIANLASMTFAGVFGDIIGVRTTFILGGIVVIMAGIGSRLIFGNTNSISALSPSHFIPSEADTTASSI